MSRTRQHDDALTTRRTPAELREIAALFAAADDLLSAEHASALAVRFRRLVVLAPNSFEGRREAIIAAAREVAAINAFPVPGTLYEALNRLRAVLAAWDGGEP